MIFANDEIIGNIRVLKFQGTCIAQFDSMHNFNYKTELQINRTDNPFTPRE